MSLPRLGSFLTLSLHGSWKEVSSGVLYRGLFSAFIDNLDELSPSMQMPQKFKKELMCIG